MKILLLALGASIMTTICLLLIPTIVTFILDLITGKFGYAGISFIVGGIVGLCVIIINQK